MRGCRLVLLVGVSALLALPACAARSKMVTLQPVQKDLKSYSKVMVSVDSGVSEDVSKEKSDLEGLVVSRIKGLNVYDDVQLMGDSDSTPDPETLLVQVTISHVKKVGGTKRFMLGAMAGRASMTTKVSFIDASSGADLGSYTIEGQSGGSGYSGGTSDAVKKTADGIAEVIGGSAPK